MAVGRGTGPGQRGDPVGGRRVLEAHHDAGGEGVFRAVGGQVGQGAGPLGDPQSLVLAAKPGAAHAGQPVDLLLERLDLLRLGTVREEDLELGRRLHLGR